MKTSSIVWLLLALAGAVAGGCNRTVYFDDAPTVISAPASGDWILIEPGVDARRFAETIGRSRTDGDNYFLGEGQCPAMLLTNRLAGRLSGYGIPVGLGASAGHAPAYRLETRLLDIRALSESLGLWYAFKGRVKYSLRLVRAEDGAVLLDEDIQGAKRSTGPYAMSNRKIRQVIEEAMSESFATAVPMIRSALNKER